MTFGIHEADEVDLRDDQDGAYNNRIPIIIDGSAFSYRVSAVSCQKSRIELSQLIVLVKLAAQLHVQWTKGGEAQTLRHAVCAYIDALRNVGLEPIFVWDVSMRWRDDAGSLVLMYEIYADSLSLSTVIFCDVLMSSFSCLASRLFCRMSDMNMHDLPNFLYIPPNRICRDLLTSQN